MTMTLRKIISIDEEKCDGCGLCVPSCAEGALKVIDGKLRLVKESYCDGLGACLGECPQGALSMIETWAEPFDEAEAMAAAGATLPTMMQVRHVHGTQTAVAACPSINFEVWKEAEPEQPMVEARSELRQWPVQLYLIPPDASFLQGAKLTLIADCVPFAEPNTHAKYIKDSAIAVGCPKLDDGRAYIQKMAQILIQSDIQSIRVVRMTVPCCGGLEMIVRQAMALSGVQVPLETVVVNAH